MIQFQENIQTDQGWPERWKDGQALFYRTLPATSRESKKHLFLIVHQTKKNLFLVFLLGTKKMAIEKIILNLKKVHKLVNYKHFQMESINNIIKLIKPNI